MLDRCIQNPDPAKGQSPSNIDHPSIDWTAVQIAKANSWQRGEYTDSVFGT
jgi:hypothetical protein